MSRGVTAVVLGHALGRTLVELVDHLQGLAEVPVVLVDAAESDLLSCRWLESLAERSGVKRVRAPQGAGAAALRNAGAAAVDTPALLFLEPEYRLAPGYLEAALDALDADPELAFVTSWLARRGHDGTASVLVPPGLELADLLAHPDAVHPASVLRRERFASLGGCDPDLPGLELDDLWLRLVAGGGRGQVLAGALVEHRPAASKAWRRSLRRTVHVPAVAALYGKHRELFDRHPEAVLAGRERRLYELAEHDRSIRERRAAAVAEHDRLLAEIRELTAELAEHGEARIDWGDLRRTRPISPEWGIDRGQPVDRPYIEAFLAEHAGDVRGAVLEVQEDDYTRAFGGDAVTRSDVVDLDPTNPRATVVADLRRATSIADATYDCFILTQTVHVIDDMEAVLREAWRVLKPGGVLLSTFPCLSRVCLEYGPDGDFWRLTEAGARRLAVAVFPPAEITTRSYGNVLTATAFLHGLAAEELTAEEFDDHDPFHPVLVGVRARKPGTPEADARAASGAASAAVPTSRPAVGVVLAYHRVAEPGSDLHGLAIPPAELRAQMEHLRRHYQPMALAELVDAAGDLPPGAVAVTFDDGYLDALEDASPILCELGIPATFFLVSEQLERGAPFWWDILEQLFQAPELPERFDDLPTATADERRAAHDALYRQLLASAPAQRDETLRRLARWCDRELTAAPGARSLDYDEAARLARRDGHTIGAHTVHHLALSHQPYETQQGEIMESKHALERWLGEEVTAFAYPYGDVCDTAVELARAASFRLAVTCEAAPVGPRTDPFRVPRCTPRRGGAERFEAWLAACFTGSGDG